MDTSAISKLLDQGLLGVLLVLAIFAIISLYKKVLELQDTRVKESKEVNDTVSIALHAVSEGVANMGNTMKSILITLERKNDKE